MRRLLIIGIGAGDPEQVTVQAIRALNEADVFFMMDKGNVRTVREGPVLPNCAGTGSRARPGRARL